MFRWFAERSARREAAEKIYDAIVAQSRAPIFYMRGGVPDTLFGRFDMLVIHRFIVLQNLRKLGGREGELLGRDVIEAFIREMDSMVRDLGVGDLQVPKEVGRIANVFFAQLTVYIDATEKRDPRALADAVRKSFQAADAKVRVADVELTNYIIESIKQIGGMPLNLLLQGNIMFPDVRGVKRAG
jgi:cytochrome b pre-mRNA-processing protein 3